MRKVILKIFARLSYGWQRLRWRMLGVEIGERTKISPGVVFDMSKGGTVTIGRKCNIHRGAILATHGGVIEIGNDSSVNPYSIIYGHGGVRIGNHVRIAAHAVFISANHKFNDLTKTIRSQGLERHPIVVEDNVWIGAGVRVLQGVTICAGSVIGAGSVVNKSVERRGVYAGVPARLVKEL